MFFFIFNIIYPKIIFDTKNIKIFENINKLRMKILKKYYEAREK